MRPPASVSIGASDERTLPPPCPSVVEEASSSWSRTRRRMKSSCQATPMPWRTTQATFTWCIA
jgi:hypothetical protein